MADIKAKEESNQLKFAEAQLKAQTEAFKAQLQFLIDQHKLEVEQLLAEQKNTTQLEIEAMKHTSMEHPNEGDLTDDQTL